MVAECVEGPFVHVDSDIAGAIFTDDIPALQRVAQSSLAEAFHQHIAQFGGLKPAKLLFTVQHHLDMLPNLLLS